MFINRKITAALAALTIGVSSVAIADSAFARGHGHVGGGFHVGGGLHGQRIAHNGQGSGFGYYGYDYNGVYDQAGNCGIYYPTQPYVNGYTYCE